MANTGLRPDEARNLEFRDVEIVEDEYSGQRILEIEVRGKRGTGYCKSMPGAVRPYERLRERPRPVNGDSDHSDEPCTALPQPTDRVFPNEFKKMFNGILTRNNLKFDRSGTPPPRSWRSFGCPSPPPQAAPWVARISVSSPLPRGLR